MIDECPICGGELQATEIIYLRSLVIDADGTYQSGKDADLGNDIKIYCENDHDLAEILEALKEGVSPC
ncbi:MAG TPA: hypothetical protein VGB77_21545 [Abditibacteriaceae bacterium]|jgi:hypothetical protein